jgi:positive regulator of sigma E activity
VIESGTVIAVRPDGTIDVTMVCSSDCATCGACGESTGGSRVLEALPNLPGARVGDTVAIEVSPQARGRAQWLVYVVPVGALVTGYLAGFLLGNVLNIAPDTVGALVALAAGGLALYVLREPPGETAADRRYDVRVRAIISQAKTPQGIKPGGHDPDTPS